MYIVYANKNVVRSTVNQPTYTSRVLALFLTCMVVGFAIIYGSCLSSTVYNTAPFSVSVPVALAR